MTKAHSPTVELASQLVSRASVTPEDAGCQPLLAERLEALGFDSYWLPVGDVSNLLCLRGAKGPLLLFLGHTDVVPAGDRDKWHSAPFDPQIRDGKLYGRGSADMKGSIAAFISACERLLEGGKGLPGNLRIGVLLTSDEEGPAIDGVRAVAKTLCDLTGPIDWCLVGEPSSEQSLGDSIRVGRRGSLSGEITIEGKQGHVAYPDLADNPLHRLAPVLHALTEAHWDDGTEDFPPTTLQITGIDTDTDERNVIPGRARARFNLRFSPALDADGIRQRIEALLADHAEQAEITWIHSADPFSAPAGPLREAVMAAVEEINGQTPRPNTAGGTSDGRFIAPLGAEVVELGPVNASIHQVDEHVATKDLDDLSAIYQAIITRLAQHSPAPS